MSERLTPNEIRAGMAACLNEMRSRLASGPGIASDERLAALLVKYIDNEMKNVANNIADKIDDAVLACFQEYVQQMKIKEIFQASMAEAAPQIVKSAAEAAIKSIPISVAIGDNNEHVWEAFPDVGKQSIGELVVTLSKEMKQIKAEMKQTQKYVSATRDLLNELVTIVVRDGGETKVFTASDPPADFFVRRTDLEEADKKEAPTPAGTWKKRPPTGQPLPTPKRSTLGHTPRAPGAEKDVSVRGGGIFAGLGDPADEVKTDAIVNMMTYGMVAPPRPTAPSPPLVYVCVVCGNEGAKSCGRCGKKLYCCKECQKKDWKAHKKVCGTI